MKARSWFGALLCGGAAFAQGPCHDLQGLTAVAQDLLAAYPATGDLCLRVDQHGVTAYEQAFGAFTLQQVVPVASATKTLSAAVLMSLVDSGHLSLDDTVGTYLPEWNVGAKASITLRMCFTHTSGLAANHPAVGDGGITLRAAAMQIAQAPLLSVPGTAFRYGGVSMHVAGAVCEVASGLSWTQLFAQRIATPLGMTATDYLAFGSAINPRIAGGARSDLSDFAAFVDMLRNGGSHNGVAVLSAASVDVMLTDQTSALPVLGSPHPENAPYGIGLWLDRRDSAGRTVLASAAGAFGFVGWVDRAHDASGVFLVLNDYPQMHPYVRRCQDECDAALLPAGALCVGAGSPPCAAGAWLNAIRPSRAGDVDFALLATRAPSQGIGAIVLGDVLPAPLPVFDLAAFVAPTVLTGVVADATGRAFLPAPLVLASPGAVLGVQAVWLGPPCTAAGLQASHALQLTILP